MAIFKLTYNSTTRQLIIPACASWKTIQLKIRTIFGISNDNCIYISFVDPETQTRKIIKSVSELKNAVNTKSSGSALSQGLKSTLGGGSSSAVKLLTLTVTTEIPDEFREELKGIINKNEQSEQEHRPGVIRRIATFGIPQCNGQNNMNNDGKSVVADHFCTGDGFLRHLVLGDYYCYA
ncbi:4638_t:CDS:2 [Ambispora leptoticha]|uniref:4638_t:CDS:1 n=1 Tax=Ambispora leptoticha TaxID=144679 RepID=A0A9N8W9D7_9GLOM|nr:4638_t:CDS:2 [Ambispora leptoticha]